MLCAPERGALLRQAGATAVCRGGRLRKNCNSPASDQTPAVITPPVAWPAVPLHALFRFGEPLGDRYAAADTEGFRGDPQPGGCLTPLILVEIDQANDFAHGRFGKTSRHNLRSRFPLNHVKVENGVEFFVRWQRILVALVRAQVRRRALW